jgi:nitrate reductase NapAB chaperone NapD
MAICSYLVLPSGDRNTLAEHLRAIPGCDAVTSENRNLLLLVTETESRAGEAELRGRLEAVSGVQSLVMTFGQIDLDAASASPSTPGAAP